MSGMDESLYTMLEEAAFAAWPALEPEETLHGWRLRYSQGYTKRANSANSTLLSLNLDDARIAEIEARYRAHGLPAIFRLTSAAAPSHTDAALQRRGYKHVDPSLVMTMPLHAGTAALPNLLDVDGWMDRFMHISGAGAQGQDTHRRMLHAIQGSRAFALEPADGAPACCGLGVVHGRALGLFDLATLPAQRRKGLATRLCGQLLAWGAREGAGIAYLQVAAANANAIRLYEQLGFSVAYHYWYRVGP